jgi:hypothetical protein
LNDQHAPAGGPEAIGVPGPEWLDQYGRRWALPDPSGKLVVHDSGKHDDERGAIVLVVVEAEMGREPRFSQTQPGSIQRS